MGVINRKQVVTPANAHRHDETCCRACPVRLTNARITFFMSIDSPDNPECHTCGPTVCDNAFAPQRADQYLCSVRSRSSAPAAGTFGLANTRRERVRLEGRHFTNSISLGSHLRLYHSSVGLYMRRAQNQPLPFTVWILRLFSGRRLRAEIEGVGTVLIVDQIILVADLILARVRLAGLEFGGSLGNVVTTIDVNALRRGSFGMCILQVLPQSR